MQKLRQFKRLKIVLRRLVFPGGYWPVLIGVIGMGLLSFVFATGRQDTVYASISYPVTLYSLTVLVLGFPEIVRQSKALISKNKYGEIYMADAKLRATLALYRGLVVNLLFVAFYAFTGWKSASAWFGAVAGYYVVLSVIRFILLRSVRKIAGQEDPRTRYIRELKDYRFCGYLMLALNMVMSGMIVQMVWQNKGYAYSGLTIYASAAYAFYCLITAITGMIKFRKMDSPVLSAAKMLSFAGALMSMLALQTAMITMFGSEQEDFRQIMNSCMGGGVFLIVFSMAIFMIVRGNRKLQQIQINNSQT